MESELILVIEDDPYWCQTLETILLKEGFRCEIATSYRNALQLIMDTKPSALILDMRLGDWNYNVHNLEGWNLADIASDRRIKSIIVTGYSDSSSIPSRAVRDFGVLHVFDKATFHNEIPEFIQMVYRAVDITRHHQRQRKDKETAKEAEQDRECIEAQFEIFKNIVVIRLLKSPMGEPREYFCNPFSKEASKLINEKVCNNRMSFNHLSEKEKNLLNVFGIEDDAKEKWNLLEQIGIRLFESLAVEKIGVAFSVMLKQMATESKIPSLHLRFDDSDESVFLAEYPWEIIHDSLNFLSLDKISVTRYITCPLPVPTFDVTFPLRVLMVVPRPPGVPPLKDVEESAIKSILQEYKTDDKFVFDRLDTPVTYQSMMRKLREGDPYHFLYYDGHGDYGWYCDNCEMICRVENENCEICDEPQGKHEGFVFFESENEIEPEIINSTKLATAVNKTGVQLVALSACHTAALKGSRIFNATAPKLIGQMIPIVIGMQYPISVVDSAPFFVEFFRKLGDGADITPVTIEDAVHSGRKYIGSDKWFYPVLYIRAR